VSLATGALALVLGLAYSLLGAIAAYELLKGRRRGWSHVGGGFMLMAATCGPHHLVHATHILLEGEPVRPALLAALAFGVVPGAVFVGLRAEAMTGGRGDRAITGTPAWLVALPLAAVAGAGAILLAALADARAAGTPTIGIAPNAVLFAAYLAVGAIVLRTQVVRRPVRGGWSLSGLSLGGVFATCGLAHLVAGLTVAPDAHMLLADVPGVPASLYFLWVVHRLNRRTLADWNRRPLVGRAAPTSRRSPWAAGTARP
jgi:hypothetical protein